MFMVVYLSFSHNLYASQYVIHELTKDSTNSHEFILIMFSHTNVFRNKVLIFSGIVASALKKELSYV